MMKSRRARAGHHVAVLAALAVAVPPVLAEGFPAENATLLEHVPLSGFPSNPSSGNDCWGYVSPSGREYALVGLRNAVAVVDLGDPAGPVIVGSVSHQSSNWCDIRTYGSYAYAVNETGGGLDVIDLSQVDEGIVTLIQRVTDAGLSTCHNIAVNEASGYLYLCASNINEGRIVAMDLADPADPVIAGMFPISMGGVPHDAQVVTYEDGPYAGKEIAFASSGTDGLEIIDVTDKQAMVRLAVTSYPNHVFTHQAWASGDLQHLYLNDEADSVNETVIFDITDLEAPEFVGSYSSGVEATDHNVFWHDGFVYEAEYRAGLRIFDASDPVNPVQVGWLDTFPGDDSPGSGGAWGTWPFFPSGRVIVSDKNRGLFVVWPDEAPIVFDVPGGAPDRIDPTGGGFVVAIETVDGSTFDPASAVLVHDAGAGSVETPLVPLGEGVFEAAFPPIPCGAIIQYHVRATTTDGIAIRVPANAPCETFVAVSAYESSTVLADGFESDAGWLAGVAGDTATDGTWERVDPVGTVAQPDSDHTPAPGTACFVTGQGAAQGGVGDDDVDQGKTTLLSPALDCTGAEQVTISYWRWYHNSFEQIDADEGNAPNADVFVVEISGDNGQTWTTVETIGPAGPGTAGGWILHAFDAGSLVELTSAVRVRFVASDVGGLSIVEAGVDDFLAVAVACDAPLVGDLDDDGDVDGADLGLLLGAWGPCARCPADLDGNGGVDGADLGLLLGNWST